MPVNEKQASGDILYQRQQYQKGGVGRLYWNYRDRVVMSLLGEDDRYILDLGCGEGITLGKVVGMLPQSRVVGIDVMQENIDICRRFGLNVRQGDIYHLDLADESVDAVVFLEVIEHLAKPEAAVSEIWRILKPRGKLVTVFPNDAFFKMARILTLKFREARYDPGHVRQWTHKTVRDLLAQCGFSAYFVKSIPFYLWPISLHGVIGARKVV